MESHQELPRHQLTETMEAALWAQVIPELNSLGKYKADKAWKKVSCFSFLNKFFLFNSSCAKLKHIFL